MWPCQAMLPCQATEGPYGAPWAQRSHGTGGRASGRLVGGVWGAEPLQLSSHEGGGVPMRGAASPGGGSHDRMVFLSTGWFLFVVFSNRSSEWFFGDPRALRPLGPYSRALGPLGPLGS